jgi:hypothetical protein
MGVGFEQNWMVAMARELRILAMALVVCGLGGVGLLRHHVRTPFFLTWPHRNISYI